MPLIALPSPRDCKKGDDRIDPTDAIVDYTKPMTGGAIYSDGSDHIIDRG